jgi:hypothetical protein
LMWALALANLDNQEQVMIAKGCMT